MVDSGDGDDLRLDLIDLAAAQQYPRLDLGDGQILDGREAWETYAWTADDVAVAYLIDALGIDTAGFAAAGGG